MNGWHSRLDLPVESGSGLKSYVVRRSADCRHSGRYAHRGHLGPRSGLSGSTVVTTAINATINGDHYQGAASVFGP